jgi:hypothetical protein
VDDEKTGRVSSCVCGLGDGGYALGEGDGYVAVSAREANTVRGAACYTTLGTMTYCSFLCCYTPGPIIGTAPGPANLQNSVCSVVTGCTLATFSAGACTGT